MSRVFSDRRAVVGLFIAGFFVVLAIFGPLLTTTFVGYQPLEADLDAFGSPPSAEHWLGTTATGYDVLSQLIAGAQQSMIAGSVAAGLSVVLAIVVGVTAGVVGGKVDSILTALSNVFLTLPAFALILIVAGYTSNAGPVLIGAIIAMFGWAGGARELRAQSLSLRSRDFVSASRMIGERAPRIVVIEVLPHLAGWIAAMLLTNFVLGILTEAGLAFLGLSSAGTVSWGTMISQAQTQNALLSGLWWWFLAPGLCILALGGSVALINFALDQSYNPRLSGLSRKQTKAFQRIRTPKPVANLATPASDVVLQVKGLTVEYVSDRGNVVAANDVTFDIKRGEIFGLAGESGSGKSTLLMALTRLERPPAVTTAGSIVFNNRAGESTDLVTASAEQLRALRWTSISLVLQSAMTALNPVTRLGEQFVDVIRAHDSSLTKAQARERTKDLLRKVGIAANRIDSYPHELSGGMRQRATIALALACDPDVVVMDEPTTAVDVVMQRQILRNVLELQDEFGFAVIFVTHDLSLLVEIADRIAVMYAGKLVEVASATDLWEKPLHPYTRGLRDSFPPLSSADDDLTGIPGVPPNLLSLPQGCAFEARCPRRFDRCATQTPTLQPVRESSVSCLLYSHESDKETVSS